MNMKVTVMEIASWGFPLITFILLLLAATRRRLPGKWWFVAFSGITLVCNLALRLPQVLVDFELLDLDLARFYNVYNLPILLFDLAAYCLLIPFIFTVANRHARHQGAGTTEPAEFAHQGEGPFPEVDDAPVGIGGWLILPAIGFVLSPIIGIAAFIVALTLYSEVAALGFGELYTLELTVEAALLAFLIFTALRFFGKKRNVPSMITALLIANLVFAGLFFVMELSVGVKGLAILSAKRLVGTLIGVVIWIPYFNVSKRVKATFVN